MTINVEQDLAVKEIIEKYSASNENTKCVCITFLDISEFLYFVYIVLGLNLLMVYCNKIDVLHICNMQCLRCELQH